MKTPKWLDKDRRKKESIKQERDVAEHVKGRAHLASGAPWFDKGDVNNQTCLISCKQTKHAVFRLSLRDLKEIENQARKKGLLPVMFVCISGDEYVILRKDDLSW